MDKDFRKSAVRSSVALNVGAGVVGALAMAPATGGLSILVLPLVAAGGFVAGTVQGWLLGLTDSMTSGKGGFVGRMAKSAAILGGVAAGIGLGVAALAGAALPVIGALAIGAAAVAIGSAILGAATGIVGKIFHLEKKSDAPNAPSRELENAVGRENQRRGQNVGQDPVPSLAPDISPAMAGAGKGTNQRGG